MRCRQVCIVTCKSDEGQCGSWYSSPARPNNVIMRGRFPLLGCLPGASCAGFGRQLLTSAASLTPEAEERERERAQVVVVVVKRVLPLDADRPGPGVAAAGVAQVEVVLGRGKEGDAAAEDLAGLQRRDPGLQAALKPRLSHNIGLQAPISITQKCGPFVEHIPWRGRGGVPPRNAR